MCEYAVGYVWEYGYTGSAQELPIPCNGRYKVELWGAWASDKNSPSGAGSYTSGEIKFSDTDHIYIYVGQAGVGCNPYTSCNGYAFNGGGATDYFTASNYPARLPGGGGATDIRLYVTANKAWNDFTSLKSRIMVAGGAGANKVSGGGLTGYSNETAYNYGGPGTQTSGGSATSAATAGKFGQGGNGYITNKDAPNCNDGYGGGGGWYGGGGGKGGAAGCSPSHSGFGGSGSSFISGHDGCLAIDQDNSPDINHITHKTTSHYSEDYVFTNTVMIDGAGYRWTNEIGEQEQMPNPKGGYYELGRGHNDNGYARITLIGFK